jgi:hypothetical protein
LSIVASLTRLDRPRITGAPRRGILRFMASAMRAAASVAGLMAVAAFLAPAGASAAEGAGTERGAAAIGQIKIVRGPVFVERNGTTQPGVVGLRLQPTDVVRTGADGSVGISMVDDSLLSLGPGSQLSLDRYQYDSTTQQGAFDASLRTGSLAVTSGRIAKQSPGAMTVRTPFAILGVRGTEFAVDAGPR